MSQAEVRGDRAKDFSGTRNQRGRLHGADVGFQQFRQRSLSGKDLALLHIFDNHPFTGSQRRTASSSLLVGDNAEEFQEGLVKAPMGSDSEFTGLCFIQLEIAFLGSGDSDRRVHDGVETTLKVVAHPGTSISDFVEMLHRLKIGSSASLLFPANSREFDMGLHTSC